MWDGELGVRLGRYDTRGEALAAVRRLVDASHGSPAPLGLTADGEIVVASGEQLIRLAQSLPPAE